MTARRSTTRRPRRSSARQAPFTGSFRPFEPLSAFDGQPATGTWRLVVRDREFLEAGTLNGWRLDVGGIACE